MRPEFVRPSGGEILKMKNRNLKVCFVNILHPILEQSKYFDCYFVPEK